MRSVSDPEPCTWGADLVGTPPAFSPPASAGTPWTGAPGDTNRDGRRPPHGADRRCRPQPGRPSRSGDGPPPSPRRPDRRPGPAPTAPAVTAAAMPGPVPLVCPRTGVAAVTSTPDAARIRAGPRFRTPPCRRRRPRSPRTSGYATGPPTPAHSPPRRRPGRHQDVAYHRTQVHPDTPSRPEDPTGTGAARSAPPPSHTSHLCRYDPVAGLSTGPYRSGSERCSCRSRNR